MPLQIFAPHRHCQLFFHAPGVRLVKGDEVVVSQLVASGDVAQGVDEHALFFRTAGVVFFGFGFAVGFAAMVDPARSVAAAIAIDDVVVVEREQEGVAGVRGVAVDDVRFFLGHAHALVFDDAHAFFDVLDGEYPAAVDRGVADFDQFFSHGVEEREGESARDQ